MQLSNKVVCLVTFLVASSAHAQTPAYFAGTGHWYQVLDANLSWSRCRDSAIALGGHLATINSQSENDFVLALTSGGSGLCALDGFEPNNDNNWIWMTGEPWSYTNWYTEGHEPNNDDGVADALFMYGNGSCCNATGKWGDIPSGAIARWFAVEYGIDPGACAGNALQFDGVNDEVDIPNSPSLSFGPIDPMTVELWFNLAEPRETYHIIGKRPGCADGNWQMGVSAGYLFFGSLNSVWTPFSAVPGTWYHIAGTYDGGSFRLYVNGQLKATQAGVMQNENSAPLRIGQSGSCPDGQRFVGEIDEVRVWNVARSSPDIAANFGRTVDPITPGLVGFWNFDEALTSQTVLDCSSAGNNGTLGASPTPSTDDPTRIASTAPTCDGTVVPTACPGNALQLDGFDDEVDITHDPSLNFEPGDQMTVELWFKLSEPRSIYHLLGKRVGCSNTNYQLAFGSGELHFSTGPSPAFRVGTLYTAPVGQWVHVAATCDGSSVRLYVNGQLKAAGPGSLGNANTEPLRIGQSGTCGGGQRFIGEVDEVRIWNVARSPAEIAANFGRTVDPNSPGLVGYWKFDESLSNQTVPDYSVSNNNGILGTTTTTGSDDPIRVTSTAPTCGSGGPTTCSGNTLQFDGGDDEVLIPNSSSLAFAAGASMTAECWIYPTPGVSSHAVLGRRAGTYMNYQISYGGGVFDFFSPGSTRVRAFYDPPLNQWTHVAGTFDGSTSLLYINGVPQGTSTGYPTVNDPAPLMIGGSFTDPRFVGQIDEVRIWNVARSGAEIAANASRGIDPSTPGLVGYWAFDEGVGDQTIRDKSLHGNDGTRGANSSVAPDDPITVVSTAPEFECPPPTPIIQIDGVVGPKNIIKDHNYSLDVDIQNVGTANASNFKVVVYLSSDRAFQAAQDFPVGDLIVGSLAPTESKPLQIPVNTNYITTNALINGDRYYWIVKTPGVESASDLQAAYRDRTSLFLIPGIEGTFICDRTVSSDLCDSRVWLKCFHDGSTQDFYSSLLFKADGSAPVNPNVNIGRWFSKWPLDYDPAQRAKVFDECNVAVLPGIYTTLADRLTDPSKVSRYEKDKTLFVFPYDWRYDNSIPTDSLRSLIESVVDPTDQVDVIAHSMGGLIAKAVAGTYDNSTSRKIRTLIFLGTPHFGSMEIVLTSAWGKSPFEGPASLCEYFEPEIARLMGQNYLSAYELFPTQELYDASRQKWGAPTILVEDNIQHLTFEINSPRALENVFDPSRRPLFRQADQFTARVSTSAGLADRIFNIVGYGAETIEKAHIVICDRNDDGPTCQKPEVYPRFGSGDGTVPSSSAEGAFAAESNCYVRSKHADLPENDDVGAFLGWQLLGWHAHPLKTTRPTEIAQAGRSYSSLATGSPVSLFIRDELGRRSGRSVDGLFFNEIPGLRHDVFPGNEVIVFPDSGQFSVEASGTESGTFSIYFSRSVGDSVVNSCSFLDIPANPHMSGFLTVRDDSLIGSLSVDYDSNGQIDSNFVPTAGTPLYGNVLDSCCGTAISGVSVLIHDPSGKIVFSWLSTGNNGFIAPLPPDRRYVLQTVPPSGMTWTGSEYIGIYLPAGKAVRTDLVGSLLRLVEVDILPQQCPNILDTTTIPIDQPVSHVGPPVLARSRDDRLLTVAVLGGTTFDATQIDWSTVKLQGVSASEAWVEDVAAPPVTHEVDCECSTVPGDKRSDLVLNFHKRSILDSLRPVLVGERRTVTLTGRLIDGSLFKGSDCIGIRAGSDDATLPPSTKAIISSSLANYPNPFNATTVIRYSLSTAAKTRLEIFDVLGRRVRTLVDEPQLEGTHEVIWDGNDTEGRSLASGMYFYRLTSGSQSQSRKMLMLK